MVIGLCGRMGSGKSTAANFLVAERGLTKLSFADSLRQEVADAIAYGTQWKQLVDIALGGGPQAKLARTLIAALTACREAGLTNPWSKPTEEPMRKLLQPWGTEYRRAQDPDYYLSKTVGSLHPNRSYVIDDVRFPNELDSVDYSVYITRRDRPLIGSCIGHVSESSVIPSDCNQVIKNDFSEEGPFKLLVLAAYDKIAK